MASKFTSNRQVAKRIEKFVYKLLVYYSESKRFFLVHGSWKYLASTCILLMKHSVLKKYVKEVFGELKNNWSTVELASNHQRISGIK